jgi:hypothetical protein
MVTYEYRRIQHIGASLLIFIFTWIFALIPLSSFAWLTLVIGMAGSVPSIFLFRKGVKKITTYILPRSIEIYHAKELRHTMLASEVNAVTYEISESISDQGLSVLRDLKFSKKDGKTAELGIESMFKTHFVVLDMVAKRVEKWCKENGVAFSIIISLPKMYENSSESAKIKEIDRVLKYTINQQGNPRTWRRRVGIFLSLTISEFAVGVACFLPSICKATLAIHNEAIAGIGFFLIILGACSLFKVLDEVLNRKPIQWPGKMIGISSRDLTRWEGIGSQGTMTGTIWTYEGPENK